MMETPDDYEDDYHKAKLKEWVVKRLVELHEKKHKSVFKFEKHECIVAIKELEILAKENGIEL